MSAIDLDAIARHAAEQVASRVLDELPRIVRAELDRRDDEELLDVSRLAQIMGCTAAALRQRIRRGSVLANLAVYVDERRMWRRRDIEALTASGRRALRVVR